MLARPHERRPRLNKLTLRRSVADLGQSLNFTGPSLGRLDANLCMRKLTTGRRGSRESDSLPSS